MSYTGIFVWEKKGGLQSKKKVFQFNYTLKKKLEKVCWMES